PMYGIQALLPADPDTRISNGNVLNEFIYTPGHIQEATINVGGDLNKAFDLTPWNDTPPANGDDPLYDANNSDDVIFGGWDSDFIHAGSGDDAVLGGEALPTAYIQVYDANCTQTQTNTCSIGVMRDDWYHPWNPGDILHFGADTNPWHANGHVASRLGEFLLYDEYDPRRAIVFNQNGSVWQCGAYSNSGHTCTDTGTFFGTSTTPALQYFLNFDPTDGRTVPACLGVDNQGNCTTVGTSVSDGNDVIFGDLGNDWLVGGTGKDTLWGGFGNDLLNVDDTLSTDGWLNDAPDGPNSNYEDRAFGGAGLDILIANTGGDRLIDWVGEFNSFIVPFAPFGMATVSRQRAPGLDEFLYALSRSQGADPTRTEDGGDPARNGEPNGEMGLVNQHDHGLWQQQTGSPTDPQAGNIPGGRRDVLRSADFNDGTLQAFAVDSGSWQVTSGALSVAASSQGGDAAAVFNVNEYIPTYFEISASVQIQKPLAGWKGNAYLIFDYWSPTDFKFAGLDVALNKVVFGHRTADAWVVDQQASVPGGVRSDTWYDLQVIVNGLSISVVVNGTTLLTTQLPPRYIFGEPNGFNMGMVGTGSDNSRGMWDNIAVKVLPPQSTFSNTEDYQDGVADLFTGDHSGTWTVSAGRLTGGNPTGIGFDILKPAVTITSDAYIELETVLNASSGLSGFVFDYYSPKDFKYVLLDPAAGKLTIGHYVRNKWVVDYTMAATMTAGADQRLMIALKGTGVTVTLNGTQLTTYAFNGLVDDGSMGLMTNGGSSSFDNTRVMVGTDVVNTLDSTPPVLNMPADVVRGTDAGKMTAFIPDSTLGTASASDNVAIKSLTRSGVPAGNVFAIGTTLITWTAIDVFGNQTVKTQKITVSDTERPVLSAPPNVSRTLPAGQSSTVVTDAQLGTATATDNSGQVTITRSGVPAGNVFSLGTTTITYTATDAAGNKTTVTQTVTVTALPSPLGMTGAGAQTTTEGAATNFSLGSFSGGSGPWTVTVDWGDGTSSSFSAIQGALSAPHTYVNDRPTPYAVNVSVTDATGASVRSSFSATVWNAAPTVGISSPSANSILSLGKSFSLSASFSDPGRADTHTCKITWGDGKTTTGSVNEFGGSGTCGAIYTYSTAGTYTITVQVTDNAGASVSTSITIAVTKNGKASAASVQRLTLNSKAKAKAKKRAKRKHARHKKHRAVTHSVRGTRTGR
ncbi:MAG: large repetitive protein, partial [Thermoleophilaceae bacterium]|nr:large repetitive protein [Thermoleophilaceae bacterium]